MILRPFYLDKIQPFINTPVIKVLTGMRRVGKSMLLEMLRQQFLNQGTPELNIILMNFESRQYRNIKTDDNLYDELIRRVKGRSGKIYILLDEIQEIMNWERAINSFLVDLDADVYITGSNARLLSSELATLLTGRYVEIVVFPLSLREYYLFQNPVVSQERENSAKDQEFEKYLKYGGLPGSLYLLNDESAAFQYLGSIFSSILFKDVVSRHQIRDIALLQRLVDYLLDNIGQIFSANSIANFLKSQKRTVHVETIYHYLSALEESYLFFKVRRFDLKGKQILETLEKYYVGDHGLRNAVIGYRDQDISGLMENIVFLELKRRGYNVYIGKWGDLEIDFVAQIRDEKIYIQVCYLMGAQETIDREFVPLEEIPDNYPKYVVSLDRTRGGSRGGIKRVSLIDFLQSPAW